MAASLHVCLVSLSGFRVREPQMLALGMSLPGLQERAAAVGALPSLGLLTLAGLTPPDWEVSYHEAPRVDAALVGELLALRPTLVAVSALTASILEAYALADALRGEGVRVVLGGLHVTAMPDEASRHADAVVVGDGEPVWREVLADARTGSLRARYEPDRPFDLADAPVPRFDLLQGRARARYTLQTARGCPFACDFCGASRMLGPFREKPAERIEAELEALSALARRPMIELADDNTFAGRRDPGPVLGALARHHARFFTECDWRLGERPEVVARLAEAGCVQVLVGLESLVHDHPGMGAKRAPLARVLRALHGIQEAGVSVIGCFIAGADGETLESLHALGEFALDAPFADVQLTLQTPFPGTRLHQRLRSQGRLLPDRSWESYSLFDVTYRPDRLSVDQLERGFRNLVAMVFAPGPSARRLAIRRAVHERRWSP